MNISQGHIQPPQVRDYEVLFHSSNTIPGDSGSPITTYYKQQLHLQAIARAVQEHRLPSMFGPANSVPIPHKGEAIVNGSVRYFINNIDRYIKEDKI